MPKEEWGVKRVCPTTGKRFYDLNRDPVVSPYTGDVVPVDGGTKTRVLVADKADAKTADEDLLIDDEEEDVLEDDDADDATAADDADDVLEDDDEDTVSLDALGSDVAENDDED